jgi:bleomycin hydrolase
MRGLFLIITLYFPCVHSLAQETIPVPLTVVREVDHTAVKNQARTGTCWSFSTISLVESQTLKNGIGEFDLSEMFIARNIYKEKAMNYIMRQGKTQFGEGGLGHDVIRAISIYGAIPENVYSGLMLGQTNHDHSQLSIKLKAYLDGLLSNRPLPENWMKGFDQILDDYLGKVPSAFTYGEKNYTPKSFAEDVLHFDANDYVNLTSFTHHPFYSSFILEVPDNFSNGYFYNVTLSDLISLTKHAVQTGYSLMWDADVSNSMFRQSEGFALQLVDEKKKSIGPDDPEIKYDQSLRQKLFANLTTQDDHLMHLVGIEQSEGGKDFFLVKNSWGAVGPFDGYIHVSEAYFAINTISLVVPKVALDKSLISKLGIK